MRAVLTIVAMALLFLHLSSASMTIIPQAHSLTFRLDSRAERCFMALARVSEDRMFFHTQLRSGGTTFDIHVTGPEGQTIFQSFSGEHTGELKLYFETKTPGEVSFCLSNQAGDPKIIMVSVAVLSKRKAHAKIDPLLKTLAKSEAALIGLTEDQVYLRTRERIHRETMESNCTRIALRGFIEIAVLLAMSVGQVFFLRRLFRPKGRASA